MYGLLNFRNSDFTEVRPQIDQTKLLSVRDRHDHRIGIAAGRGSDLRAHSAVDAERLA